MRRAPVSSVHFDAPASSGRRLHLGVLLAVAAVSCDGARGAPDPVSGPVIVHGNGEGNQSQGASSQGGGSVGGNGVGGAGGQVSAGGNTPVDFPNCGCAVESVSDSNGVCGDCVDIQDTCFMKLDDCLNNSACLQAYGKLSACGSTPTLACAESKLEGMGNVAADLLLLYFDCVCSACTSECAFGSGAGGGGGGGGGNGGGGGAGGGPVDATCTIAPP